MLEWRWQQPFPSCSGAPPLRVAANATAATAATADAIATAATATPKDIASECYLLELAYKVTKARKNTAFSDILVDCPGYENWTFEIRPGRTASHFAKR